MKLAIIHNTVVKVTNISQSLLFFKCIFTNYDTATKYVGNTRAAVPIDKTLEYVQQFTEKDFKQLYPELFI